jgi:hypothetical protein
MKKKIILRSYLHLFFKCILLYFANFLSHCSWRWLKYVHKFCRSKANLARLGMCVCLCFVQYLSSWNMFYVKVAYLDVTCVLCHTPMFRISIHFDVCYLWTGLVRNFHRIQSRLLLPVLNVTEIRCQFQTDTPSHPAWIICAVTT